MVKLLGTSANTWSAHHAHSRTPCSSASAACPDLNLREYPRSRHTSVVFERLDDLGPDGHLVIASEYEPETLRRQIEGWCPDEHRWAWMATGPRMLRAEITRRRRSHSQAPGAASASALPITTLTARQTTIPR
jgi:uncharacterized protein (DUF2249 family)